MMMCQSDDGLNGRQRLEGACAVFASCQVAVFLLLGARPLYVVLEVVDCVQVALLQGKHTTYCTDPSSCERLLFHLEYIYIHACIVSL